VLYGFIGVTLFFYYNFGGKFTELFDNYLVLFDSGFAEGGFSLLFGVLLIIILKSGLIFLYFRLMGL
jgi:hypothetical protein